MSAAPRVVMVSAGFWPALGGAESQALELARALGAKGCEVLVLTRRVGLLAPRETVRGVSVRRLPVLGSGALDSLSFLFGALGWLLKHGAEYDAIHAHLAGSPALAAAAAGRFLGKPVVVKLGGGRGIGELAVSSRSALGRLKLGLLSRMKPHVLAVVPDLAEEARERLGATVEVLPNGVDAERFKPVSASERAALRGRLGWSGTVFLYTGRLSWEKRLPWFARLWDEAACKESSLVLVGEGPDKPQLEEVASASFGRIKILPPVPDTAPLYAAADVFVLPSVSEGLSNSLLEAMASGTAILASAVGGTRETVENGVTGLLFEKDDEKALKSKVSELEAPGRRAELGAKAREAALRRYSLERVTARLLELYRGAA